MASQYEKRQKAKKDSETTSSDITDNQVEQLPEGVDRDAYDVFLNHETNKYIRVRINYNLERGTVEIVEVKDYADGQAVASGKINELFVRKLFRIDYK